MEHQDAHGDGGDRSLGDEGDPSPRAEPAAMSRDPQRQIEQTRAEIEQAREQIAEDVDAMRERADLRARMRDGARARVDAAVEAGRRAREGFGNRGGSATGPHRLGRAARELGLAATAAGWRK